MPRRGENIFKRKDGRWEARYIHHYEGGKAKYRYIYGDTYAEAKQKRAAELACKEISLSLLEKQSATVEQMVNAWLRDIKVAVKESTYTRYDRVARKYFIPNFGSKPIIKVDAHQINRFSEELLLNGGLRRVPLSPKSVTDMLCIIKSIYKFGERNGYPCSDLSGVRYPQRPGKEIKIITPNCRKAMESILLDSEDSTSLGILFSLFTGIRIGELCGLRWGDIDLNNAIVRICRTVERIADLEPHTARKTKIVISEPKTENACRTIPIPRFLRDHLLKHERGGAVYLVSGRETLIEPHCFYVRYKKFLKRHQINDYTFHAIRHTFATRCVEFGFDTKSLAEILGHANVTTTLTFYVHPSMEQKRSQMELLTPPNFFSRSTNEI